MADRDVTWFFDGVKCRDRTGIMRKMVAAALLQELLGWLDV